MDLPDSPIDSVYKIKCLFTLFILLRKPLTNHQAIEMEWKLLESGLDHWPEQTEHEGAR